MGAADKDGVTPLHGAAQCGWTDAVIALLVADAPVGAADKDGATPLHRAVSRSYYSPTNVVAALLAAAAPVHAVDAKGSTPLGLVVTNIKAGKVALPRLIGTIEALCAWGADAPASARAGRSLTGKRRRLRTLLAKSPRMTERERAAAKDKWRRDAAQLTSKTVEPPSAADRALETLRAA